jgi:uncharacterized membrane protein YgaE (UPF0421/DUF939 family)
VAQSRIAGVTGSRGAWLRPARGRLRSGRIPVLQTALAAGGAWLVAQVVLGHEQPAFAAIVATIALAVAVGRRGRRAAEVVTGVVAGIAVAQALSPTLGAGPAQVAVTVALAMCAALVFGAGLLLTTEAAVSSVLVVTLASAAPHLWTERLLDALVGGAVAIAVNALLFPPDPALSVGRAFQNVIAALGEALAGTRAALETGDGARAEEALARARGTDGRLRELDHTLAVAYDSARLTLRGRGRRAFLDHHAGVAVQLDLAARNTRVLARAAVRHVATGQPSAPGLAAAVDDLGQAVWALGKEGDGDERAHLVRGRALSAAARATAVLHGPPSAAGERDAARVDMATEAGALAVRATAVDLLRASGLELPKADGALDESVDGSELDRA